MQDQLLSSANRSPQSLQTRLDILLGRYLVLCGDNSRAAKLSELSVIQYLVSEGPTFCWVLVLQSDKSKNNQQGALHYMGAIRHRNPKLCTMGALAQYLFWRWYISGDRVPNFQRRQDWYRLRVLVRE